VSKAKPVVPVAEPEEAHKTNTNSWY